MATRLLACALLPALLWSAPAKKLPAGAARGENENLILSVTVYSDPTDVKNLIGDDLGGHYIVADVKMQPKYGKTINVDRDDFLLVTAKDGERTTPFAPTQVAGGSETLIVSQEQTAKKTGGIGSTLGAIMMGGAGEDPAKPTARIQKNDAQSPLLLKINEKSLPVQKITEATGGLLFFPMEKQKLKDLELRYGSQDGRITLHFKEVESK